MIFKFRYVVGKKARRNFRRRIWEFFMFLQFRFVWPKVIQVILMLLCSSLFSFPKSCSVSLGTLRSSFILRWFTCRIVCISTILFRLTYRSSETSRQTWASGVFTLCEHSRCLPSSTPPFPPSIPPLRPPFPPTPTTCPATPPSCPRSIPKAKNFQAQRSCILDG